MKNEDPNKIERVITVDDSLFTSIGLGNDLIGEVQTAVDQVFAQAKGKGVEITVLRIGGVTKKC